MTHYLGMGDDGAIHWWASNGGEALTRICDGVESTSVEMFARDLHTGRKGCQECEILKKEYA